LPTSSSTLRRVTGWRRRRDVRPEFTTSWKRWLKSLGKHVFVFWRLRTVTFVVNISRQITKFVLSYANGFLLSLKSVFKASIPLLF
jgi:hypothetical protein